MTVDTLFIVPHRGIEPLLTWPVFTSRLLLQFTGLYVARNILLVTDAGLTVLPDPLHNLYLRYIPTIILNGTDSLAQCRKPIKRELQAGFALLSLPPVVARIWLCNSLDCKKEDVPTLQTHHSWH